MWPIKRPVRLTKYNKQARQCPAKGRPQTNDHASGKWALDRTPEESANCRHGGLAPGAGISVPEKRPFSSRSRRRCYSSRYFFLGGVAIFMSEGADFATFGFSFFGFLASRLLRT